MKNKKTALNSYSANIPLVIILAIAIGLVTVSFTRSSFNVPAMVLGDRDENKDSEDKKDEEDKEDEEDEDKNKESEKKENEKKREESKKVEERRKEESKKYEVKTNNTGVTTTKTRSVEMKEVEDENEIEDTNEDSYKNSNENRLRKEEDYGDDNELEKHEEKALVSSVTNEDGTITKTIKNVDGDEIETKIITYDATGKIINKVELNEDGSEDKEKVELVTTVTNEDGTITKTFKKSEGTKVEMKSLTYDANGVLIKKAELNSDGSIKEEEIINEDENDDLAEAENEDEFKVVFKPSVDGSVDPILSRIIGAKLEQEIENDERLGTTVNKVELEIKTVDGTIKYEGTAESTEKLLGVFDIQIASDIEVDPVTGKILSVNQSFWTKVVSFFSF